MQFNTKKDYLCHKTHVSLVLTLISQVIAVYDNIRDTYNNITLLLL